MIMLLPWLVVVVMAAVPARADVREAFVERHCIDCHSGEKPAGELDVAALSRDLSGRDARQMWTAVHDRIAAGEMPPADAEQPSDKDRQAMLADLSDWIAAGDETAKKQDGRAVYRRLTTAEYENALRDLLDLPNLEVRRMLPQDGTRAGFDKVAGALDLSQVQMQQYLAAVDRALDMAIATRSAPPPVLTKRFDVAPMLKFRQNLISGAAVLLNGLEPENGWCNDGRKDPDDPGTNGRNAPLSGRSVGFFTPKQGGHEKYISFVPVYPGRYRMRMSIWSFVWNHGSVEPSPRSEVATLQYDTRVLGYFDAASLAPQVREVTAWLSGGHPVMFDVASLTAFSGTSRDHRPGIAIDWFEVEGPLHESWPPDSHRRLFGDLPIEPFDAAKGARPPSRIALEPANWAWPGPRDLPKGEPNPPMATAFSFEPQADATRLLAAFMARAFRRPVPDMEVAQHVAIVMDRIGKGDCFEDAMRQAYKVVLTSPHFLFRRESPGPLDGHALATRLALWLWNGPPDDELLRAAAADELSVPAGVRAQIDRLLADPRADRFVADFLDQWLSLQKIDDTDPDKTLYPEFQFHYLKDSMLAESRAFFRELIAENLPIESTVVSDFAMLNERLAQHYAISGLPAHDVPGSRVRRVALPPGSHRGGFLTQGAVLKVTANGTTTSPVIRGVFVSERILGNAIPPPPPNIPAIEPDTRGATTIREQLMRHQADTACASCHRKMDPPGYALESFDVIGGWRERYRSEGKGDPVTEPLFNGQQPRFRLADRVDASGQTPDGEAFSDFEEFRRVIAARPDRLARAFVGHMVTYATGAEPSFADRREIDQIIASTDDSGFGIRSLIEAIATSQLFLQK